MAKTPSTMLELGTTAPDFSLPDTVSGKELSLADCMQESGLLVMFICNHCPFVLHIQDELAKIGDEFQEAPVGIVAISSNDVANYPEDSPEKMKERAAELGFSFPYLYDESQEVAQAFQAACTPDFFLFDGEGKLVYRGQLDDSRPGNGIPVTGADLRSALTALLSGEPIPGDQKPSVGCNIKWKS